MRLCFVVMPIGSGDNYRTYLNRYENIFLPAVAGVKLNDEAAFDCVRGDFISSTGSINRAVIQHLHGADAVIADRTDLNPIVFYELGVRHALRNGTILVALKATRIPFDLGDMRVVFYEDRVGGEKEAIPQIQTLLRSLLDCNPVEDSPVFQSLPDLRNPATRDLAEAQARVSNLEKEVNELRIKLAVGEETNLRLRESFNVFERTIKSVVEQFGPQDQRLAAQAVQEALRERKEAPRRSVPVLSGIEEDVYSVFVLMPFRREYQGIYNIIRRAGESAGLRVFRADEMVAPGRITDQILDAIRHAGLIVADVSDTNPNVLYEIGLAHSLNKPTILISRQGTNLPFDLSGSRVIFYEDDLDGAERLREQLVEAFRRSTKERDG